jgi:hypothetical protein
MLEKGGDNIKYNFQGRKKKIPITSLQGVKKNNPLTTHSIT